MFFSSRRRHTSCALVTGVQTCALPISHRTVDLWLPSSAAAVRIQRGERMNGIPVEALLRSPAQADAAQDRFDCLLREQRDGRVRFLLTRLPNEAEAQEGAQEKIGRAHV